MAIASRCCLKETRLRWASQLASKQRQRSLTELRAMARELNIKGRSRMSNVELLEAIGRVDPKRLE